MIVGAQFFFNDNAVNFQTAWKDIDFSKMTISINKTLNYVKEDFIIGPPKTENSYRTLGMNQTIKELLLLVKKEPDIRKKELLDIYKVPDLVFTTSTGNYIHRNNINNHLNKIKTGTSYEYITVHFLRHANASLLLNSGVDLKIVSAHLGHNDIQTTANIYADVLKETNRQVAQIIEFGLEDPENEDF